MRFQDWSAGEKTVGVAVAVMVALSFLHLVVGLGNVVAGIGTAMRNPDASGWAQAFGTVLAVVATGGVAWWEAHQRRLEARRRLEDQVQAHFALVHLLTLHLDGYMKIAQDPILTGHKRPNGNYGHLRLMLDEVFAIQVREMPTRLTATSFVVIKGQIEIIRAVLDETGDMPPDDMQRRELEAAQKLLLHFARKMTSDSNPRSDAGSDY